MVSDSERRSHSSYLSILPFDGKSPHFDETVYVDPTARLIGDVLLGSGVSVYPFALLRADSNRITVGEGSVIRTRY